MGPVQGKCQIVRMLHDRQHISYDIGGVDKRRGRLVSPNLEHVEDHKVGKIRKQMTEIPKCLEFYLNFRIICGKKFKNIYLYFYFLFFKIIINLVNLKKKDGH
jgi:hypothetical protein